MNVKKNIDLITQRICNWGATIINEDPSYLTVQKTKSITPPYSIHIDVLQKLGVYFFSQSMSTSFVVGLDAWLG